MKRIGVFLCFLVFCAGFPAIAQQKLTSEFLWKLGRVGNVHVSPDGSTIIYTVTSTDVPANRGFNILYSMPAAGGTAKKLNEREDALSGPRWRPDGKKIGYLSSKSGEMQLWEMNPDGSDKKQVTKVKGGVSNLVYSPAGTHILFTQDVKLDKTVKDLYPDLDKTTGRIYDALNHRHWDSWHDGTYNHVVYLNYKDGAAEGEPVDIMKNEKYDAPVKPFGGEEQLAWSKDGKQIFYTSKKEEGTQYAISTNSDIYSYDIASGKTENLSADNKGYDVDPLLSPDGSKLAWMSMKTPGYESDKNRIIVYDLKTKTKTDVTANDDITVDQITWSPDGKNIYCVVPKEGTKQLFNYSLDAKNNKWTLRQVTQGMHDYTSVAVAKNGKNDVLIGTKMSMSAPSEIFSVNPAKGTETALTTINKELLSTVKMGKVEKRMVKTVDGKDMLSWVVYPPDFDPTKKYPTLLYCQGGPQSVVSQFFSPRWNFQLMAANGYIVIAPNRRGLPSFGQEWNDAIIGDYGGKAMQDYLSAIDDISKENYVDKDKRGAVGASFGGYSVYWLAGNHNKRFNAFIAHCGMFNMESWYGSTEEMFFANNDQKGPYWKNPAPYEKFSPHKFVKNWDAPILVIHNEKDFRVPLTQGLEAFTAAQTQGIPSRLLYFPDENHWVLKPQNSILWNRVFFDWLDTYLKKDNKQTGSK